MILDEFSLKVKLHGGSADDFLYDLTVNSEMTCSALFIYSVSDFVKDNNKIHVYFWMKWLFFDVLITNAMLSLYNNLHPMK